MDDVTNFELRHRARRGESERDETHSSKLSRNVIFRQMCDHKREIIAPARSS